MGPIGKLISASERLVNGVGRRVRAHKHRLQGARIGPGCWLREIDLPRNHYDVWLEKLVSLDRGVILLSTGPRRSEAEGGPRIVIREGVYCNRYTMFDASERIEIGARTMIGPHCYITDHDHGIRRHMPIPKQPLIGAPVVIGHDAWLGAGVTILKGVTIGEGAIVAANAVVTKDVPPFSIVAGVPAKVIGERPE